MAGEQSDQREAALTALARETEALGLYDEPSILESMARRLCTSDPRYPVNADEQWKDWRYEAAAALVEIGIPAERHGDPAGSFVAVPSEPTKEMMVAFEAAKDEPLPPGTYTGTAMQLALWSWSRAYRAMIAAARPGAGERG